MTKKHSHCSFCGAAFAPDQVWPRTCTACGNTSYVNPLPVAVLLIPVEEGFLAIRRKIEPKMGTLNLSGGFINLGETWQQACVRELYEKTGVVEQPERIDLFTVKSAPDGTVLVFGRANPLCGHLAGYSLGQRRSDGVYCRSVHSNIRLFAASGSGQ